MRLERVEIFDPDGNHSRVFRQFSSMTIRLTLVNEDPELAYPYVSLKVLDNWSQDVCQTITGVSPEEYEPAPERFTMDLVFESLLMMPGNYTMEIIVAASSGTIMDSWSFVESFSVLPRLEEAPYQGVHGGVFSHPCKWVVHRPKETIIPQPAELGQNES